MKYFYITTIILFFNCYADNSVYDGEPVNVLIKLPLPQAQFHIYQPPLKIKPILESIKQAACDTPENLLLSIRSATNQDWVDLNNHITSQYKINDKAFEYRKNINKETNYFLLLHKLQFSYSGKESAILTYHFVDDDKIGERATLLCQKFDDRWKVISHAVLSNLEQIMMIDSNLLEVYFNLSPRANLTEKVLLDSYFTVNGSNAHFDVEAMVDILQQLRNDQNWDALQLFRNRN